MRYRTLVTTSLLLVSLPVWSAPAPDAPSFDDVFGSHMVLPHDRALTLGGKAAPNQRITLTIGSDSYRMRSDGKGVWKQQVKALRAGGPYTVVLRDEAGASTSLTDVLAGEVWLCSGQSNMEFPVAMSTDQPASVLQGNPAIRLLSVAHQTSLVADDSFAEKPSWVAADAESIKRFSALCYFFAQQKFADASVPIGLVNASWGGSAIEAWISERQFAQMPDYRHQVELLRAYRATQRKSELRFAEDWVSWWQRATDMGPVWQQGVLDGHADWRDAPLQDWRSYPDQRLKTFTGNLWFSTRVDLSEGQSRKGATFVLGKIDEVDTTWVNGKFVNNSFGYGTRREYRLEPGMLRPGVNQFSVFVTNTYDAGGMTGPESDVGIRFDDGEFISLGNSWKYRIVPKEAGYPPRAPWESVHGVSGMFNGMIAPLQALQPTGVIWYQGESNVDNAAAYESLLGALIKDWRAWFGTNLPFIVIQLPNYGAIASTPAESGWATLRNAQQQVALRDPAVGLVITQDLGNDADIHPRRKFAVAERAVQVARALNGSGPKNGMVPHLVESAGSSLTLEFMPPLDMAASDQSVMGFSLCAQESASCVPVRAVHSGARIQISREALPHATRLRWCWSDGGGCGLHSLSGIPVSSFEMGLPPR